MAGAQVSLKGLPEPAAGSRGGPLPLPRSLLLLLLLLLLRGTEGAGVGVAVGTWPFERHRDQKRPCQKPGSWPFKRQTACTGSQDTVPLL